MHSFLVNFALISLLQQKNITMYDTMDACGAISDRPCWASRFIFFVKLTNLHSILSEHKAREDNVITLLLPWSVNKSQMSARLQYATISYQLLKILRRRKDGQSMSARLKCANIS